MQHGIAFKGSTGLGIRMQIVVEIRGGVLSRVWDLQTGKDVEVVLRDWDDIAAGDPDPIAGRSA